MSYRSEVRCLIYGAPKTLTAFLEKESTLLLQNPDLRRDEEITRYRVSVDCSRDEVNSREIEILDLNGAGWTWYGTIKAVTDWHRFMDEAHRAGLEYEFLRVGEAIYHGDDDIEYYGSEGSLTLLKVDAAGFCAPIAGRGENIPLP